MKKKKHSKECYTDIKITKERKGYTLTTTDRALFLWSCNTKEEAIELTSKLLEEHYND